MAWNAMDALNRNTQAAVTDERPKARFRIRDISIKKMYIIIGPGCLQKSDMGNMMKEWLFCQRNRL